MIRHPFFQIGTHWDQKERMFRNIGGLIGPRDDPVLVHRWVHGEEFHVRLVWQDPLNVIAGLYTTRLDFFNAILFCFW